MPISRRSVILAALSFAAWNLAAEENGGTGPYCWAGAKDGKDVFIPCGSNLPNATVAERDWLTLDLSDFAGLRVVLDGKSFYISGRDIFTVLTDSAKP